MLTLREYTDRMQAEYIHRVIQSTGGNVAKATRILGVNRTAFYKTLERLRYRERYPTRKRPVLTVKGWDEG